jgi:hypothetical protein
MLRILSLTVALPYPEEMSRKAREDGNFHEEMYFVSQLFEEGWQPGPIV